MTMIKHHLTPNGCAIAYEHIAGAQLGVIFLSGFRSDMESTKATVLAEWAAKESIQYTRFDYFAHGKTGGDFKEFTIGRALADTLEIIDHVTTGKQILVGSSMGGWVALLAALERKERVKALVGIAAAPDFTERMFYKDMTAEQRAEMQENGLIWVHSDYYQNDYPLTMKLIEDGKKHLLMQDRIPLEMPISLLHGQADDVVPWEHSLAIAQKLNSRDVTTTFIKDGDHRLNRPEDTAVLIELVQRIRAFHSVE